MYLKGVVRKPRSPGAVDSWLESLGYYRKNVAYDETCMFRAVSEQLFFTQVFHERIRTQCVEYGRAHYEEFKGLGKTESEWQEHLDKLEMHMTVCGTIEMHLICKKYERDILLCRSRTIINITNCGYAEEPVSLCLMDADHYDAVYKIEKIENAGFCQSIIYKILYENVFGIPDVDNIVKAMLYDKTPVINITEIDERRAAGKELTPEELGDAIVAPFPFKVAKALDPKVYRNIEYDSWGDVRRELRLGDWYYGDDQLKLGTRCVFTDATTQEKFDCYIQELHADKDKCVIYVTKTAKKRVVLYSQLAPEADAKPWPLPFRFSKGQAVPEVMQLAPIEKVRSARKKRKEKKQYSKSTNDLSSVSTEMGVMPYVGAPLQISGNSSTQNATVVESTVSLSQAEGLLTPNTPDMYQYPRYSWEPYQQWPTYAPPEASYYRQDPFVWPPTSPMLPTPPYYEYKPMVASAPVTPSVIPYHEPAPCSFYNDCRDQREAESAQGACALPAPVVPMSPQGGVYGGVPATYVPGRPTLQPIQVYNGQTGTSMFYTPVQVPPPGLQAVEGPVVYAPPSPIDGPSPGVVYPSPENIHHHWYHPQPHPGFMFPTPAPQPPK